MNANTNLIPITKLKISKEKWLETQIKYDENLLIKDIVDMMSEKTFHWIQSKSDLQLIVDQDSFKLICYTINILMEEINALDLFELKYLEEIHELFNDLKLLNNHYNVGLFDEDIFSIKGNSGALSDFIFDLVNIDDPYVGENSDSDDD